MISLLAATESIERTANLHFALAHLDAYSRCDTE